MPENAPAILLETLNLAKAYDGVTVLDDVSIQIKTGTIVGIIGENGAGKSTLTKCINGMTRPSGGRVVFQGEALQELSVAEAIAKGIVTIPQEFNLVSELNVYENIFLGHEPLNAWGLLDRPAMRAKARELLSGLNAYIDPERRLATLSVAEKQMVEIAKALTSPCRLLIMDEPSTVLNQREVETLFSVMRRLRKQGSSILYISHKLKEIRQICDEVIVLRDGQFISHDPASALSEAEMARRMVGRELNQLFPPKKASPEDSECVLELRQLQVPGLLREVNLRLHRGEVLGLAGLLGAGRTELAETLYGLHPKHSGQITLFGEPYRPSSPAHAIARGLAYLSEDRQGSGILLDFSVAHNISLSSLRKYGRAFIDSSQEKDRARHYIDLFGIKTPSGDSPLRSLSGGNQQKVAIAKGLDSQPKLFIFDEPTRGIDIKAKSDVYGFIRQLLDQGIACLLISSDLEELIGMCQRVAVMREGSLVGEVSGAELNEENIMYLATGVS
jgi:ribose transport system ATP-binding protein